MPTQKQTKRKGFEWFRMLTKKQQKQFRKNLILSDWNGERFKSAMNDVDDFNSFIACWFTWVATPQGHNYWRNISEKKL